MIEGTASLVGLSFYTRSKYNGMALGSSTLRKLGIVDVIRKHSRNFRDRGDVRLSTITEDSGPQNLRNFSHFIEDTNKVYHSLSSWA